MRTGSRGADAIMYSSTHTVANDDNMELLSIDRPTQPLAVSNVKLHAAVRAPRDKTERHVRHDDCCGYCERYCVDKITHLKRREIEAWRHDVDVNMEARKASYEHNTKKPKLTFMKFSAIGKPDTDPGFRRIKTPKDVARYQNTGGSHMKGKHASIANDGDLWGKYSSRNKEQQQQQDIVEFDPGFDRALEVLGSPTYTDFSKDSLDSADSCDEDDADDEETGSSQHSYRSTSNRLLNVLTIDDAIKNHRDRLLKNNIIKTADPRRRKLGSVLVPQLSLDGVSIQDKGSVNSNQSAHALEQFDPEEEFRLHGESELGSRPVSKVSALSFSDPAGDFRLRSSTRMQRSSDSLEPHNRTKTSNHNVMLKAVDDVVSEDILPEKPPMAKPHSKRFRKMNKNLRNLIDKEFLPDHRMTERLNYFSDDKKTSREATGRTHSKGRSTLSKSSVISGIKNRTPLSAKQRVSDSKQSEVSDTISRLTKVEDPLSKSVGSVPVGGNQFLAMLANYSEEDNKTDELVEQV